MTLDSLELKARLTRRLSLIELVALTSAVFFAVITIILQIRRPDLYTLWDFMIYSDAARGNLQGYYYGQWSIPLIYPFAMLPFHWGALAWQLVNIGGMFFAARLFGGKSAALLFSYPVFSSLFLGQISGVLCLGMALMWLGLSKRSWLLAGVGLTLTLIKPQVGIIAGILWLYALLSDTDDPAKHRRTCWMALMVPLVVFAVSFIVQPDWASRMLEHLQSTPPNDNLSFTAWKYIGAWGLLLLVPPLILRLNPRTRLLAIITAWLISAPYFQPGDMSALFMLLPNWLPLLSWLAVPPGQPQLVITQVLLLLLTVFYICQILPAVLTLLGLAPVRFSGLGKFKFLKSQKLEDDQQDEKRIID